MKCLECGRSMKAHGVSRYHYLDCGLTNIYLRSLTKHVCGCGEEEISISNLEELHVAIADDVASQEARLKPEEIRFLRVHLGFSGAQFAAAIDVVPETVSRWENGKAQMAVPAEKLLRTLVKAKVGPFRDYAELAHYASKTTKARREKDFETFKGHWGLAA